MKANEFKAWLEGFSEAVKGSPTKEQWEKIKQKAKELDEPERIVEYRNYWPYYVYPTYQPTSNPWWSGTYTISGTTDSTNTFTWGANNASLAHCSMEYPQ